jgi:hypothetical protein
MPGVLYDPLAYQLYLGTQVSRWTKDNRYLREARSLTLDTLNGEVASTLVKRLLAAIDSFAPACQSAKDRQEADKQLCRRALKRELTVDELLRELGSSPSLASRSDFANWSVLGAHARWNTLQLLMHPNPPLAES